MTLEPVEITVTTVVEDITTWKNLGDVEIGRAVVVVSEAAAGRPATFVYTGVSLERSSTGTDVSYEHSSDTSGVYVGGAAMIGWVLFVSRDPFEVWIEESAAELGVEDPSTQGWTHDCPSCDCQQRTKYRRRY